MGKNVFFVDNNGKKIGEGQIEKALKKKNKTHIARFKITELYNDTNIKDVKHQAFITRRLPMMGINGNPLSMLIDRRKYKGLFVGLRGQGFMLGQYLAKLYVDKLMGKTVPEYFDRLELEGDGLLEEAFK